MNDFNAGYKRKVAQLKLNGEMPLTVSEEEDWVEREDCWRGGGGMKIVSYSDVALIVHILGGEEALVI